MTPSDSFDDLSRRWQQQPLPRAGHPTEWQRLLAQGSRGPLTQMRRQVWAELLVGTLITIPLLAGLLRWPGDLAKGLAVGIALLSGCSLFYYYYQLRLLGHLRTAADPLRQHAAEQLRQFRALLRLGHGASLGLTVLLAALLLYGATRYVLPTLSAAATRSFLLWFGLTVAASLLLVHWLTRWHSHEAYGRHLNHLETVLRELAAE